MVNYSTDYDYVLVQRFDLVWNLTPDFYSLNPEKFYVGKPHILNGKFGLNPSKEWSDRWFISCPTYICLWGS